MAPPKPQGEGARPGKKQPRPEGDQGGASAGAGGGAKRGKTQAASAAAAATAAAAPKSGSRGALTVQEVRCAAIALRRRCDLEAGFAHNVGALALAVIAPIHSLRRSRTTQHTHNTRKTTKHDTQMHKDREGPHHAPRRRALGGAQRRGRPAAAGAAAAAGGQGQGQGQGRGQAAAAAAEAV